MKINKILLLLCVLGFAVLFACKKSPPSVEKVDAPEAYPGSIVTIHGKDFGKEPSNIVVKVGDREAKIRTAGEEKLVIELPDLEPGRHSVVVIDSESERTSEPFPVEIRWKIRVPVGTKLSVKTDNALSSETHRVGDTFSLTLVKDIVVDGKIFAPEGSKITGKVTHVLQPGRVKGRAQIGFTLVELKVPDREQTYSLSTESFVAMAPGSKKKDALTVGLTTGIGAVLGGLAGGKKGAAIGAGTGAAAGTGIVLMTRGNHIKIPENARLNFLLTKPIETEITRPLPPAH